MAKFDLNSHEWCNIIFEGRNKDYGAYDLRVSSTKRYLIALSTMATVIVLPLFFSFINYLVTPKTHIKMTEVMEMSKLVPLHSKAELHVTGSIEQARLNNVSKKSVHYTVPIIKKDSEALTGDELKSQEELSGAKTITGVVAKEDSLAVSQAVASTTGLSGDAGTLKIVKKLPEFPGGPSAFMKWLTANLQYPAQDLKDKVEGKVVVQFIVQKSGAITNVKILQSLDSYCDNEVLRVISTMPKWKPGEEKGRPVLTMVVIPVMFKP
ncbi:MAG: energy transducer TonB [Bacteroidota bacterium]|nr:energy transducer TonB [Bacteroidota bacterium]